METASSLAWAKAHKREVIARLLAISHAAPELLPAGIFMAGLPGAGKTELSRYIIEDSGVNLFRIDMDEIASLIPGYTPERADNFRQSATTLLSEAFSYALKHSISFILDGTFGSAAAIQNVERCLKRNIPVQIVYAFQDPKLAWEFTLAREKVEHRAIQFDGFIASYYKTIANIKTLGGQFASKITLDIAVKNRQNQIARWFRGADPAKIDELLRIEYNKDKLVKHILGEHHGPKANH